MTASDALLNVARLGVPLSTLGYAAKKAKKKKKKVSDIIGMGTGTMIGAAFTKAVYE
jgi:hypothetical protein